MLDKIYLEITNVCNLSCTFCHKTRRAPHFMTEEEFCTLADKLCGKVKYLYFHLMGEPTLHPLLSRFIRLARERGFLPIITTNGSLLGERGEELLLNLPYKISISLHAPAANPTFADEGYIDNCIAFAKAASKNGCFVAMRLWNRGSGDDNSDVLRRLHEAFPDEWVPVRGGESLRMATHLFLEWGDRFEWPDPTAAPLPENDRIFCYALRDHAGVLCDGTVVPCCLDADGNMALGNLFDAELEDILASPRAKAIRDAFSCRRAAEDMCKSCGFATRFARK